LLQTQVIAVPVEILCGFERMTISTADFTLGNLLFQRLYTIAPSDQM